MQDERERSRPLQKAHLMPPQHVTDERRCWQSDAHLRINLAHPGKKTKKLVIILITGINMPQPKRNMGHFLF